MWISIAILPPPRSISASFRQEFNFNQFEQAFDIVVNQAGYYGLPPALARERAEKYLKELGLWDKRDVARGCCPVA